MVIRYVGAAILLTVLWMAWILSHTAPPYNPDSWTYVELARSIGVDFYRIQTYRAFQSDVPYSASFPPLWPSLIWLVDQFMGPSTNTGYLVSFLLVLVLAGISEVIVRRHFSAPGAGILATVVLLFYKPFLDDVLSGGTISLSVLLIALLFWLLLSYRNSNKGRFLIGLTAGLLVLTRFDGIPVAFALMVVVSMTERDWKAAITTLAGFILGVVPWVVYCLIRFGVPFQSDNSLIASSIDPNAYVTDFYPVPPLTWQHAPGAWIAKLLSHLPFILKRITMLPGKSALIPLAVLAVIAIEKPLKTSDRSVARGRLWPSIALALLAPLLMAYPYIEGFTSLLKLLTLVALIAFPGLLLWVLWGHLRTVPTDSVARDTVKMAVGMMLALLAAFPAYLMTGYADDRYFSPLVWFIGFLLVTLLIRQLNRRPVANSKHLSLMLVVMIGVVTLAQTWDHVRRLGLESRTINARQEHQAALLQRCIDSREERRRGTLLLLRDDILAARLGATTDLTTALKPRNFENLNTAERRQFLQRFHIAYVFFTNPEHMALLTAVTQIKLLPECELEVYEVRPNS